MGCVSSKPKAAEDGAESPRQRVPSKRLSRTTSSSREAGGGPQMMNRSDSRTSLIDRKGSSSIRLCEDRSEKSRVNPEDVLVERSDIRLVPKAREGEQVAAGWPSWLAAAAGDAITGWIPRRADSFERLDKVEQLHKIFKLCDSPPEEYWEKSKLPHSRAFKPQRPYRGCVAERFPDVSAPALALIETLLSIDPSCRGTATAALESEFFTSKPFACAPSTLPKFPPSKEIDA